MKSLTVEYSDHIESPLLIADLAFTKALENAYGKLIDVMGPVEMTGADKGDIDCPDWDKFQKAVRQLNLYMNGVGFTPDEEDSDIETRIEDLRLYCQEEPEVQWIDYIADSRDA